MIRKLLRRLLGLDADAEAVTQLSLRLEALCDVLGADAPRDEIEHTLAVIRSRDEQDEDEEEAGMGCHPAGVGW